MRRLAALLAAAAALLAVGGTARATGAAASPPQRGFVDVYSTASVPPAGNSIPQQANPPSTDTAPATHSYADAAGGRTRSEALFHLSFPGLTPSTQITSLTVTIDDDPGTGAQAQLGNTGDEEDVNAASAVVRACLLTAKIPDQGMSDSYVPYDCAKTGPKPLHGRRVAGSDGVGHWTFDLTPLAAALAAPSADGFAIVPDETVSPPQSFVLAYKNGSGVVAYTTVGTGTAGLPPVRSVPGSIGGTFGLPPAGLPAQPGVGSVPLPTGNGPAGGDNPAPMVAAAGPSSPQAIGLPALSRSSRFFAPYWLLIVAPLLAGGLVAFSDRLPIRVVTRPRAAADSAGSKGAP